ncbi:nuclear transport factor 2 family protein [Salinibacterium sp. ZJ454]|uniref:nuclear transport factor 2 family protein n=1 Tax=Salinibacterium sp. ZJ454 TaxID=2708339 RepID=UPI00141EED96|nr:nuclear transport factor 2 family protein [Salinibacterium sp. ZJ454]
MDPGDEAVRALVARAEIEQVVLKYCRGVDRQDWNLVRSCYHADAVDNHGSFIGGPDSLVEWMQSRHASIDVCVHFVGNVLIDVHGDEAAVESYYMAYQELAPGGVAVKALTRDRETLEESATTGLQLRMLGRYVDWFERRDEVGWRIAHRQVVIESGHLESLIGQQDWNLFQRGDRTPNDHYKALQQRLRTARGVRQQLGASHEVQPQSGLPHA